MHLLNIAWALEIGHGCISTLHVPPLSLNCMPSINLVLNPSSFFPPDSSIQSSSSLQPDEGTVVAISELPLSFVAEMYRFLEQAACAALLLGYVVQAQNAGICPQDNGKTRTTPSGMSLAPLCIQKNLCTTSSFVLLQRFEHISHHLSPPVLLWCLLSAIHSLPKIQG